MKKIAIWLSVALNVVFVAVFTGGYAAVASGYLVRLFIEPAHERWVSQFAVLPVVEGDTVFLGDSITEGGSWHELFPNAQVRNRGIGGDVSSGVLERLDQVSGGRPGQVFLLIGTNDLAFDVEEATVARNVARIVQEIHEASPGTEVFVQSVLPRAVEFRDRVESLNGALKDATSGKARWIDLYPTFLDDDGSIDNAYSNDELHLNGAGYLAWRELIAPHVNKAPLGEE